MVEISKEGKSFVEKLTRWLDQSHTEKRVEPGKTPWGYAYTFPRAFTAGEVIRRTTALIPVEGGMADQVEHSNVDISHDTLVKVFGRAGRGFSWAMRAIYMYFGDGPEKGSAPPTRAAGCPMTWANSKAVVVAPELAGLLCCLLKDSSIPVIRGLSVAAAQRELDLDRRTVDRQFKCLEEAGFVRRLFVMVEEAAVATVVCGTDRDAVEKLAQLVDAGHEDRWLPVSYDEVEWAEELRDLKEKEAVFKLKALSDLRLKEDTKPSSGQGSEIKGVQEVAVAAVQQGDQSLRGELERRLDKLKRFRANGTGLAEDAPERSKWYKAFPLYSPFLAENTTRQKERWDEMGVAGKKPPASYVMMPLLYFWLMLARTGSPKKVIAGGGYLSKMGKGLLWVLVSMANFRSGFVQEKSQGYMASRLALGLGSVHRLRDELRILEWAGLLTVKHPTKQGDRCSYALYGANPTMWKERGRWVSRMEELQQHGVSLLKRGKSVVKSVLQKVGEVADLLSQGVEGVVNAVVGAPGGGLGSHSQVGAVALARDGHGRYMRKGATAEPASAPVPLAVSAAPKDKDPQQERSELAARRKANPFGAMLGDLSQMELTSTKTATGTLPPVGQGAVQGEEHEEPPRKTGEAERQPGFQRDKAVEGESAPYQGDVEEKVVNTAKGGMAWPDAPLPYPKPWKLRERLRKGTRGEEGHVADTCPAEADTCSTTELDLYAGGVALDEADKADKGRTPQGCAPAEVPLLSNDTAGSPPLEADLCTERTSTATPVPLASRVSAAGTAVAIVRPLVVNEGVGAPMCEGINKSVKRDEPVVHESAEDTPPCVGDSELSVAVVESPPLMAHSFVPGYTPAEVAATLPQHYGGGWWVPLYGELRVSAKTVSFLRRSTTVSPLKKS